jgi:hypothetical protein
MTSKGKKLTRTFFLELSLLDVDAGWLAWVARAGSSILR